MGYHGLAAATFPDYLVLHTSCCKYAATVQQTQLVVNSHHLSSYSQVIGTLVSPDSLYTTKVVMDVYIDSFY